MPKEMFYKIPLKKQELILKIAREEFKLNNYNDVSINSIVKKSNIARGSFYNYFEDIQDLFLYSLNESFSKLKFNLIRSLEISNWDILKGINMFFKHQLQIINNEDETLILNLLSVELNILNSTTEQKQNIHQLRLKENEELLKKIDTTMLKDDNDLPILIQLVLPLVINELIEVTVFKVNYNQAIHCFEKKIEFIRKGAYNE